MTVNCILFEVKRRVISCMFCIINIVIIDIITVVIIIFTMNFVNPFERASYPKGVLFLNTVG